MGQVGASAGVEVTGAAQPNYLAGHFVSAVGVGVTRIPAPTTFIRVKGISSMRLPDRTVVGLSEEEIALLVLAGYPPPKQCVSTNCLCYGRQSLDPRAGALCRCCIRDSGLLYKASYVYECDGRLNEKLFEV